MEIGYGFGGGIFAEISNEADTWVWDGASHNKYSVSAARKSIDLHFNAQFTRPTFWSALFPSKINIFLWRLRLNRLATKDNIARKGIELPHGNCIWCVSHEETASHVFCACDISRQIWCNIGSWINIFIPTWNSLDDFWIWFDSIQLNGKRLMVVRSIIFSTLWNIWRLRNSYIFNDKNFRIANVLDNIIVSSFFLLFSRYKKARINWSTWLQNPLESL
ncbi:uncharacterized protein [Rutidosis leptorrhynchoides]|uniref:uncharacterized protein n=1 Tax=Rutidosis leptorrhynchoides TaxID=125765 RepID=UPI003A9907BE